MCKEILFISAVLLFHINAFSIEIIDHITTNTVKLELIKEYCREHYGIDSYELKAPKMIVIHYTEIPDLNESIKYFSRDMISADEPYDYRHGRVNVGIHFMIDLNGDIHSFYPAGIIARHTIGYNYTSIGIENIALNESSLTEKQLESNAELIQYLAKKYPTIEYLIGHLEYNRKDLPHYKLFRELDRSYYPPLKQDPGADFMKKLRKYLSKHYGLSFKE